MTREEAALLMKRLRRQGFDMCKGFRCDGGYIVKPRCSRCQTLTIQGTACHETGCPNARRKRR